MRVYTSSSLIAPNPKNTLPPKGSNFLHTYLQKTKKTDTFQNTLNLIEKIKFNLQFFYQNKKKDKPKIHQKANQIIEKITRNRVISTDVDYINDRLLILLKSGNDFTLFVKELKNDSWKQSTTLPIISNEQFFLSAKFYCPMSPGLLVLLGLNQVYLIRVSEDHSNFTKTIDLTHSPQYTPISPYLNAYQTKLSSPDLSSSSASLLAIYSNKNYTDFVVTAANSFLVFYSQLSPKITVICPTSNLSYDIYASHLFDKAETSHFSPHKVLFYSNSAENCQVSIYNLKTRDCSKLTINESLLVSFTRKHKFDPSRFQPTSSNNAFCKFQGQENNILVSLLGMVFIFRNLNFDKENIDLIAKNMVYTLVNVVCLTPVFNTQVSLLVYEGFSSK